MASATPLLASTVSNIMAAPKGVRACPSIPRLRTPSLAGEAHQPRDNRRSITQGGSSCELLRPPQAEVRRMHLLRASIHSLLLELLLSDLYNRHTGDGSRLPLLG